MAQQHAAAYNRVSPEVQELFGSIAKRYDLTNSVLSMGVHHLWRKKLLALAPQKIECALDLCTGTADLALALAPRSERLCGVDFSLPMLRIGGRKIAARGRSGISLFQGDALQLPFADASFNLVTAAFGVRNFENLEAGLREIKRVLRKEGVLLVLEFGEPNLPVWSSLYRLYAKYTLPLIGRIVTGNRAAYDYLRRTSLAFPCREEFCEILSSAGFNRCTYKTLTGGIAYIYRAQL